MKTRTLIITSIVLVLVLACEGADLRRAEKDDSAAADYRVLFVGDTSFGENYMEAYAVEGGENILETRGYDYCLEALDTLLHRTDLVIANLETPIARVAVSPFEGEKAYIHRADVRLAPAALVRHGITVVTLANNHTLDYGVDGLYQTLDVLDAAGVEWFGAGRTEEDAERPYRRDVMVGGQTVRIVVAGGFEYIKYYDKTLHFYAKGETGGAKAWDEASAGEHIRALREAEPDAYIVAFPHWGRNYAWKLKRQRLAGRAMIDEGADLVIGHGAHMFQEIERYRGRWIVYNLGNFMFNSRDRYELTNKEPLSLAARMDLYETQGNPVFRLRLYPILSDNDATNYQPRLVTEEEFALAEDLLLRRSPIPRQLREGMTAGRDAIGRYFEIDVTPGG
jgi:poly-gamma-glutamate capsule biosynthesis protein CapA/YwtB (metallophosphatase superfamily)